MANTNKEYKVLEARTVNMMAEELNQHGAEGWEIALYLQEFAVTKVVLVRDKIV